MTKTNNVRWVCAAGLLSCAVGAAWAQVVGDEPCPIYAVDVASFATCDGDRVARAPSDPARVDARLAHALKRTHGDAVLLIDLRRPDEIAATGLAEAVDAVVVYAESRDADDAGAAPLVAPAFIDAMKARIAALGGSAGTPLLLLCRTGVHAERAARALRAVGVSGAIVVDGGYAGAQGWIDAGLPVQRQPDIALLLARED
ncbi:MAG: hypothetical protein BroJett031_22770 [Betaproteobacteria bacterium]|nr:MAG: hypothetical protein BroJett031_22770 [Betaproteobacteria bacterium]